jgi:hypothetical protein
MTSTALTPRHLLRTPSYGDTTRLHVLCIPVGLLLQMLSGAPPHKPVVHTPPDRLCYILPCRCLTMPALWTEANKQSMRKAAVRAGLVTTMNSPHLKIILEPEAAALHALVHKAPPLQAGTCTCI